LQQSLIFTVYPLLRRLAFPECGFGSKKHCRISACSVFSITYPVEESTDMVFKLAGKFLISRKVISLWRICQKNS